MFLSKNCDGSGNTIVFEAKSCIYSQEILIFSHDFHKKGYRFLLALFSTHFLLKFYQINELRNMVF